MIDYTSPGVYVEDRTQGALAVRPPVEVTEEETFSPRSIVWEHVGDGDVTWEASQGRGIVQTSGFIIVSGSDNGKAVLRALNILTGEVEVEYTYSTGDNYSCFFGLASTTEGGVVVCGCTNVTTVGGDGGRDAAGDGVIAKFPAPEVGVSWVPEWLHIYDTGGEGTSLADIKEISQGNYIVGGQRKSVTYAKRHACLIRMIDTQVEENRIVWDNIYQANEDLADYYVTWFAKVTVVPDYDGIGGYGYVCVGGGYWADYGTPASVTITTVDNVATVEHTAHGIDEDDIDLRGGVGVLIEGADLATYNGHKIITYIDEDHYSYAVTGDPASPATGTITSTPRTIHAGINLGWVKDSNDGELDHQDLYLDPGATGSEQNFEGRAVSNIKNGNVLAGGFRTDTWWYADEDTRDVFVWEIPAIYDGTFGDYQNYSHPVLTQQDNCFGIRRFTTVDAFFGYSTTSAETGKDLWLGEFQGTTLVNSSYFSSPVADRGMELIAYDEDNINLGIYLIGQKNSLFSVLFVR